MPSALVYNGIVKYVPGGITRISADALNPVTPGENSIVMFIGEADGGEPGVLFAGDDSSSVKDAFISGALVDAANLAFSPSNDPEIPGGASRVYLYKTNASTQASVYLPSAPASTVISSTATSGTGTTLVDSAQITGSVDDQYNNMWVVLRPLTATMEIKRVTDYTASTGTFTVGSAWSSNPIAADAYLILSDTVNLIDKVAAASTTTVINTTVSTMVADEHIGRWVWVHRVGATPDLRRIVDNTTSSITVTPSLPSAPTTSAYVEVLPKHIRVFSKNYGTSSNNISVDLAASGSGKTVTVNNAGTEEVSTAIGGVNFLQLLFKGAPVVVNDTVAASSTTTVVNLTTAGLTPSAHVGQQVIIDGEYTIITANTASALTVSPALSVTPDDGSTVQIFGITRAVAKITGTGGAATNLSTTTGIVGADLNISFSANQTVNQLISLINANTNYLAVLPGGINGDTALVSDFDFGATTQISILVSPSLTTNGFRQDNSQLVNYLSSISAYVSAERVTGSGLYDGEVAPGNIADPIFLSGAIRGISTNSTFQAGFDAALTIRANSVVPLIDQDLINEGFGSTATIASVAAQLRDHVVACRGAVGSERGGFLGFRGTKSQIITQAAALNDIDVALTCQNPTLLSVSGTLQSYGPSMMAAMAAGCRAGGFEVGTPLTNKVVKVSGLSQDASWSPNDLTDANDMIKAGVLFAATDDNNVTRWVRDLTTWIADNNLAFSEGSVRDEVRYVAYNLRKGIVDAFTGKKNSLRTITAIRDRAVRILEGFRSGNIIVDTTDIVTGEPLRAYHNLKVSASGDTYTVDVSVCPSPGINFGIFNISLVAFIQSV